MKQNRIYFLMIAILTVLIFSMTPQNSYAAPLPQASTCPEAILHYQRANADYDDWGLHIWGPTDVDGITWTNPFMPTGEDDFGIIWTVPMQSDADLLNYIVHLGDEKDPGPDQTLYFAQTGCEIWLVQGDETQYTNQDDALAGAPPAVELSESPVPTENQVIIHYKRSKNDYTAWGLHAWGLTNFETEVTWTAPLLPAGQDKYGLYWIIELEPGADSFNYIVHKGDEKDPGPDQKLEIEEVGQEIWLIQGSGEQFMNPADANLALELAAVGDITKLKAYWVSSEYIVWPVEDFDLRNEYALVYSPDASIRVTPNGLEGVETPIPLSYLKAGLPEDLLAKFPHLKDKKVFTFPPEFADLIPEILRGQHGVAAFDMDGNLKDLTGLQIPGVLDELFAFDGALGITWEGNVPTFNVWAPTAQNVSMLLYTDLDPSTQGIPIILQRDDETGVWSKKGKDKWVGQYYQFVVDVYVPSEGRIVSSPVTDPYSVALAPNSTHSLIVDLNDPNLFPAGWEELQKPELAAPEDIVLYELHVRDFSAFDTSIPEAAQGTFAAFTYPDSNGMHHLAQLSEAGLTHIHLLPVFDIATINEDKSTWLSPDHEALGKLPPDSDKQQALVNETRTSDAYNWGYDPYHYSVPEGSYATDPSGTTRIIEFREMLMALNNTGLRVVMDVVYNHTSSSGLGETSVLDKIVPGYYYRLNANGVVESSTCCSNTATEHYMMEKLMLDSVLQWSTAYKVDGFRFDLMGHHMVSNMVNLREKLDALTIRNAGVDGKSIYLYGEGWNFGEVGDNARGINATQTNLAGTGIGTFNDRIRDAARGGTPFGGLQEQGFINGLYTNPNEVDSRSSEEQLETLLQSSDLIRIGLAGNLADYQFQTASGEVLAGSALTYNGNPGAGYTADPQEVINYVSAHDNETLFDAIQFKAPASASMEERVRMQNMGISLVSLGQGIPFFHAGSEILRTKSLDRDSYDSGDWFNQLDYTYQSNHWGGGLPIADKNSGNWDIMQSLLSNPNLAPNQVNIEANFNHFLEMLQIRKSSPLFRLQSAEQVMERVAFHNTGQDQIPGVIVMSLDDRNGKNLDNNYDLIVVVFNGSNQTETVSLPTGYAEDLYLHPILAESNDATVQQSSYDQSNGSLTIPAQTTAVFVMDNHRLPQSQLNLLIAGVITLVVGLGAFFGFSKSRKESK